MSDEDFKKWAKKKGLFKVRNEMEFSYCASPDIDVHPCPMFFFRIKKHSENIFLAKIYASNLLSATACCCRDFHIVKPLDENYSGTFFADFVIGCAEGSTPDSALKRCTKIAEDFICYLAGYEFISSLTRGGIYGIPNFIEDIRKGFKKSKEEQE